ncbi:MAG: hypothetical protein NXH82_12455 [Rhodobacteraceae bacterium]|nr:hypothetical protein [Paracoccaceae bacterium]
MTGEVFEHATSGRSLRTALVVGAVYAALLAAILVLGAAWWIMALVALTTFPALWDLWTDRGAGLRLDNETLRWHAGRHHAELDLREIDHMRFDTRLDFSVRVSAVLPNRRRIRLPYESLPPHKALETALTARGIRVERHHFSLLG